MFKTITTAAIFALTAAASPVLADNAKPHQFGKTVTQALGFLTITGEATPSTRDAQIYHNGGLRQDTLRNSASSTRSQVFPQDGAATSRTLNGLEGFNRDGLGRIDR